MNKKPVLIAAIAAIAASSGVTAAEKAKAVTPTTTTVVYQGVQVAIDPATGRLRTPTAADRLALSKALQQQTTTARAGTVFSSIPKTDKEALATLKRNPKGVVGGSMQVPESRLNYLVAERRTDGSLRIEHQGDEAAAAAQEVSK